MTIIEDKKEYRKQLDIVKNESNGETVRKEALGYLSSAYDKIIAVEPKCPLDTPDSIREKFITKLDVPDVIWYTNDELEEHYAYNKKEILNLELVRKLAYMWVKQNHPKLNDQLDKFGQIVNARMQIIVASRQ